MDNQSPIQGALQSLQGQEQQGVQIDQQKRKALLQQFENTPIQGNQQSAISQALGQLNDNSTAGQIGKAIQTPAYAGYCLQYVDDKLGNNTNRQPTAIADYQSRAQQGQINNSGTPPKGARVYFSADQSNGNMGHIGISNGDNTFTSATDNGIKTFPIKDWQAFTSQQFLGWSK